MTYKSPKLMDCPFFRDWHQEGDLTPTLHLNLECLIKCVMAAQLFDKYLRAGIQMQWKLIVSANSFY